MSLKFNFEGKVALITGSSSGIGAATALLFSKSGANVVVTGRNADNVLDVAKQCREASKSQTNVLQVVADITKEEDLKRLVNETIKKFGRIDILVNNAGAGVKAAISDSDYMEKFNWTMVTNLYPVVQLTHLCVQHLEKTKGNIINISSSFSKISGKQNAPFNVAKAGLDMFTSCMASELGSKRIRVNVINPGLTKTNMATTAGLDKNEINQLWQLFGSKLPVGRIGEAEDMAYAILFLASDVSSFTTGTSFVSDGGHLVANVDH